MKKLIMGLQDNRQVYAFVVFGVILIIFPNEMGKAAPYVVGIMQLLYGCLNIIVSLKYPRSRVKLGEGVISIVIGVVLLVQRGDSISILGVVWGMISLYEAGQEIDEIRKEKKISPVSIIKIIGIVISIVLAGLLMANPFEHFYTHVRILGLEVIVYAFVKSMEGWKSKKDKEQEQA